MKTMLTDRIAFYLLSLVYPATLGIALYCGGIMIWMTPFLGGVIFPIIDELSPRAKYSKVRSQITLWKLIYWFYIPLHFALLGILLFKVSNDQFTGFDTLGLTISFGIMAGALAFPLSHEFIHSRAQTKRGVGLALLCSCLYMHFRVEHVYGHHAKVATRNDPATARIGEALGPFLIRSVVGQLVSSFQFERNRSKRRFNSQKPVANRVVTYISFEVTVLAMIGYVFGGLATLVFVGQAIIAILLLETVNYIEHYGLERRFRSDGRPEPVGLQHSWNSSRLITNAVLFNLGLHSHHHTHPGDRYWELTNDGVSRELPFGYFVMIVLATIPPMWRRVMDPLIRSD